MPIRLDGIFPPMPTVFDADDRVDAAAIQQNVARWNRAPLAGVLALGSNGEAPHLDEDESADVIAAARAALAADRTLIAGTGRESTRHTIAACRRAADAGADAVLVRTPMFFKGALTAAAIDAHFRAVADASPVPVILYNMPAVTGVTLTPAIVGRLAEHAHIIGIKETSVELERLGQFAAAAPAGFTVLCGAAPVIYPALATGAGGGILAAACVVPDLCAALFDDARAGRHAAALARQRALTPIARLVTSVHGIAGLKAAMDLAGYRGGAPRAPMAPILDAARDEIAAELQRVSGIQF
jgi:4-hydroxy-2-oxoglutarate aldolase